MKKFLLPLATGLFVSFVVFSYIVAKEAFVRLDFDTTVKLQDKLPSRFDLPLSSLSVLGSIEITGLVWLSLLVMLLFRKKWLTILSFGILFPFGLFLELFGKLFVLHPGPPNFMYRGVFGNLLPKFYIGTDFSYPSGHMYRTAFLVAFFIILLQSNLTRPGLARLFLQFFLFSFFTTMFISRIYLGEHWLSDVIGGSLLGASFGILSGVWSGSSKSFKSQIKSSG